MRLALLASVALGQDQYGAHDVVIQYQVQVPFPTGAGIRPIFSGKGIFKLTEINFCYTIFILNSFLSLYLYKYLTVQAWDAEGGDNVWYEATFKRHPNSSPTNKEGRGYTFDEVKDYCDSLGRGFKMPVPKNEHENDALVTLERQGI